MINFDKFYKDFRITIDSNDSQLFVVRCSSESHNSIFIRECYSVSELFKYLDILISFLDGLDELF